MERKYYNISYTESPYLTLNQYMANTFRWMFCGLLLTFVVAAAMAMTGFWAVLYTTGLVFVLSIAELILVGVLAWRVAKLQPGTATALFFAYAALNGVNLSVYFIVYDLSKLILAFLVGSVYFGVMAVYGSRTQKDLSSWGTMLLGALIALLVVTLAGTLLAVFTGFSFGALDLVVCAVGLLVFMGFTAYDTQKIKYYYSYFSGDDVMLHKASILGALDLYLDYINILLYVLRILGRSRRD